MNPPIEIGKERRAGRIAQRAAALALALLLGLAMSLQIHADTGYTLTINESQSGHTFRVYQIFTGDYSLTDGKDVLSNIAWGDGVTADGQSAYGAAQAKAADLIGSTDTQTGQNLIAFARDLAGKGYLSGTYSEITDAGTSSTPSYSVTLSQTGYYLLIEDPGTVLSAADAYNGYIFQVLKNTTVTPKNTVPVVEKKVKDVDDSTGAVSWQDSADYDIGDTVSFAITALLGSDSLNSYSAYKLVFHDSLAKGLTFKADTLKVSVDSTVLTDSQYTLAQSPSADGLKNEITISIENALLLGIVKDSSIKVEYDATLNENASLNFTGNDNQVYLEYSSNPTSAAATKTTASDLVRVFTYSLDISKTDGETGDPLNGAAFSLEKFVFAQNGQETVNGYTGNWTTYANNFAVNADTSTFTATGLDAGIYRLKETTTPTGYNTMDPQIFVLEGIHDDTSDAPALTGLSAQNSEGNAIFSLTDQKLSANIANYKGTKLPSTGGAGTTWIYIIGSALMIAALIWYITKKRMGAKDIH